MLGSDRMKLVMFILLKVYQILTTEFIELDYKIIYSLIALVICTFVIVLSTRNDKKDKEA